jgi:phosphonate transport system permease protein
MNPAPDPNELPRRLRRWQWLDSVLILFLIGAALSTPVLKGSGRDLDYMANLRRFLGYFWPPDFSVLPSALLALLETAQIAMLATLFALLLAVPLGMAGARTVSPRWLVFLTRLLLNAVRTLPSLILALIAVAIVGGNALAGVVALTFYSLGYLGKFFADAFESADFRAARALRQTGAHPIQAFQYGLWPNVRPLIWSHTIWMLEYNLRSASIIGYVGAGGLGLLLHTYQEFYAWDKFATVLLLIFILVCLLDGLGEWARRRITGLPADQTKERTISPEDPQTKAPTSKLQAPEKNQ